ncbi:hypothetical protein Bca52824_083006 [Brassica carinata]|uniref:Uncharacterized protein n=1 Tax=Brassica carinata TaxID=52824 RepID=A0A8X7TSF9_BRACI|nr:hypothetical protein Bca52824_083006 [Brassica carinata]
MKTSAEKDDGDGLVTRDRRVDLRWRKGSLRQRRSWWFRLQSTAEMNKENETGPWHGSSWSWTTEQDRAERVKHEAVRYEIGGTY